MMFKKQYNTKLNIDTLHNKTPHKYHNSSYNLCEIKYVNFNGKSMKFNFINYNTILGLFCAIKF